MPDDFSRDFSLYIALAPTDRLLIVKKQTDRNEFFCIASLIRTVLDFNDVTNTDFNKLINNNDEIAFIF